jgi:hypothetical protein
MKDYISPYKEVIKEKDLTPTKNFEMMNVLRVSQIPLKKEQKKPATPIKTPIRTPIRSVTPIKTPEK